MLIKRALLLAALLVGSFAQDARELAVSKPNEGGEIKVVKNADDVFVLANRYVTALVAGWNTTNAPGQLTLDPILAQYAPDATMTVHSSKGGFSTGFQLLADANAPLTTQAALKAYLGRFLFLQPIPKLDPSMKARLLSKDVAAVDQPHFQRHALEFRDCNAQSCVAVLVLAVNPSGISLHPFPHLCLGHFEEFRHLRCCLCAACPSARCKLCGVLDGLY